MAEMETVDFGTYDELIAAQQRMHVEGWDVLRSDDVERGAVLFSCSREQGAGREFVRLRWWRFGRELRPKVTVCATWQEFVREIQFRVEEEMDKSDDLEAQQVGFVTYGRAATDGTAEVFRLPVSALQAGGPEARSSLIAILMRSRHPGAEGLKAISK